MPSKKEDPCQRQACQIQKCLQGHDVFEFHTHLTGHSESGSYYFHGPTQTGHPELGFGSSTISTKEKPPPDDTFLLNTNNTLALGIVKSEPSYSDNETFNELLISDQEPIVKPDPQPPESEDTNTQDYVINATNNTNSTQSTSLLMNTEPPFNDKLPFSEPSHQKPMVNVPSTESSRTTFGTDTESEQNGSATEVEEVEDIKPKRRRRRKNKDIAVPRFKPSGLKRGRPTITQCHICSFLGKRKELCNHIETEHDGDYRWKCASCLIPFITEEAYDKHMSWCKGTWCKSHACIECNNERLFFSRENLVAHICLQHDGQYPLQCSHCKELIVSKYDQDCHMSIHDKTILQCPFCKLECKSVFLREHHIMKHIKNAYTCFLCEKEFNSERVCYNHVIRYKGDNAESECICDKCGLFLPNQPALIRHKKLCERKFVCEICDRPFCRATFLDNHLYSAHGIGEPFVCDVCGEKLGSKSALGKHMLIKHTTEQRYVCKICGYASNIKRAFEGHLMVHEDKYAFECDVCGKQFRLKWNLITHQRQHTGEKPYSCSKCGKSFTHNVARKGHESKCNMGK